MTDNRLIIIYESLDEPATLTFENEFVCKFDKFLQQIAIMHVDSYSEKYLFQYAIQALEKATSSLILILNDKSNNLQGATVFLNKIMKNPDIEVIKLSSNSYLDKIPGIEESKDREQMLSEAYKWISKSSASS